MSRASVHCCPSRLEQREAFGNVVLEAKMSGIPSVVTIERRSARARAAPRRRLGLSGDRPPKRLAEGLAYFLSRPDDLDRAGHAALASAVEYSEARFTAAWSEVFGLGPKERDSCASLISISIALGAAGLAAGLLTGDWLAGVSVMTLMVCIRLVYTDDRLFVLPMAVSFHWMQGNARPVLSTA